MYRHFLLTFLFVLFFGVSLVQADQPVEGDVVLLPFNAQNSGRYQAIKDNLRTMLAGRLATKPGITVRDGELNINEAGSFIARYPAERLPVFDKLATDFIGRGTMKIVEDALRFEMEFFSRDGSAPKSVLVVVEDENKIVDAVDLLANRIAEKVFGHAPRDVRRGSVATRSSGQDAFQTEHPDRKYKQEIISGVSVFAGEEFAAVSRDEVIRRRSSLADGIVTLALGNVDGVEGDEIVVVSEKRLHIFHYERGILTKRAKYPLPKGMKVHAVNLADLNRDENAEIYISGTRNNRFSSLILGWNEKAGFSVLYKNIRFAIRPYQTAEEGDVLLAQQKSGDVERFFEPGIYVLHLKADTGKVEKGRRLFLPSQLNLFDFIHGDVDGDGLAETVAVTSSLRLALYDRENRLTWVSEENYGGSIRYLGERWNSLDGKNFGTIQSDDENYVELQYVPPKLVAEDINNDGKVDIIVAKNILSSFEMLTNFRVFSGGKVACLSWNGLKMTEIWQTDMLDGYVSDIDFAYNYKDSTDSDDADDDGGGKKIRLLVGQVPSSGFTDIFNFLGDKANLYTYEFKIPGKTEKQSKSEG